jgi:small subunit ribosomal protein S21
MTTYKDSGWSNDNFGDRMLKGTKIFVKNNDVNKALRKLKKRLQDEGWFNELRKREHYVAPGERRRKKLAAAEVREKKRRAQSLREL